jgi:hypothetical protein
MNDNRNPTHVYLRIKSTQQMYSLGILAAADRVENERRGAAQAAPSLAPRDFADYGPLSGEARQERTGGVLDLADDLGGF